MLDAGGATAPLPPDLLRCLAVVSPNETELQGLTGEGHAVQGLRVFWKEVRRLTCRLCGGMVARCMPAPANGAQFERRSAEWRMPTSPRPLLPCPHSGMPTDTEEQVVAAARQLQSQVTCGSNERGRLEGPGPCTCGSACSSGNPSFAACGMGRGWLCNPAHRNPSLVLHAPLLPPPHPPPFPPPALTCASRGRTRCS